MKDVWYETGTVWYVHKDGVTLGKLCYASELPSLRANPLDRRGTTVRLTHPGGQPSVTPPSSLTLLLNHSSDTHPDPHAHNSETLCVCVCENDPHRNTHK